MTAWDMFSHLPATLITRHTRHAALAHNRDVDAGSRGEFVVRRCKSHGSLPKGTAMVGFMRGICAGGRILGIVLPEISISTSANTLPAAGRVGNRLALR
jgi:hypothetical protein